MEGNETILVVEDEPMVRSMTSRALERKGYRVLTAENGLDAYERFADEIEQIDLMVTDVVMPEMDGRELGRKMTKIRPELKILYVSGYAESGIVKNGMLQPGIEFLAKPYPIRELVRRIREMLETSDT